MIKKILIILLMGIFTGLSAQKKGSTAPRHYTVEEAEASTSTQVLATFIKENPNHPKTPELKLKLVRILQGNAEPERKPPSGWVSRPTSAAPASQGSAAVPSAGRTAGAPAKSVRNMKDTEETRMINHILNPDPNSMEAYVELYNDTECPTEVLVKGPRTYKVKIEGSDRGHLLVFKGKYSLSGSLCGKPFGIGANFTRDAEIHLTNR